MAQQRITSRKPGLRCDRCGARFFNPGAALAHVRACRYIRKERAS